MGMGLFACSFGCSFLNKIFQHFCCKKSVNWPQTPCEFDIFFLTTVSKQRQAYLLSRISTEILRRKYYAYAERQIDSNNFRQISWMP